MAAPQSPDAHEFRQMRNDVDDAYGVLTEIQKTVAVTRDTLGTVWAVQRRHGNRLDEIQQTLDLHSGRLDRMEDNQRRQGEHLGRIEETQTRQGERLGRVEGRLEGVEGRLEGVEGRLEGVDERLGGVGQRLGGVDQRLGRIEGTQQQILDLLRGRPAG